MSRQHQARRCQHGDDGFSNIGHETCHSITRPIPRAFRAAAIAATCASARRKWSLYGCHFRAVTQALLHRRDVLTGSQRNSDERQETTMRRAFCSTSRTTTSLVRLR